jgi:exodeoxyribonuclease V gamma subunit
MLVLHRNNRMELLLAELGEVLRAPRLDVFQPEVIVVQSLGMERWLSMGLAAQFGVWANARHPFPRAFIDAVSDAVIGPIEERTRYTREVMTFHLAQILTNLPEDPSLLPLQRYLSVRAGVVPRLELAEQLADAFDQVQIYRPDWMKGWLAAPHADPNDFRPALFKQLVARLGEDYVPRRMARLVEALHTGAVAAGVLPERICLFGVASLPPAFIQVFDALAQHVPVHWFLLTASREYVGAERGKRELARGTHSSSTGGWERTEQEFITEQPLLANYGRIMRDVGLLLERDCAYVEAQGHPFVEPEPNSVLATLQADVCALRRRGRTQELPKLAFARDDRSIEIHACHGPRRELEVLRDRLLHAFESDPSLRPEDVIVLLRDVEIYAPLVEAVFAGDRGQPGTLPYVLSDRTVGAGNPLSETLVLLLDFVRVRVTAKSLTRLIAQPAIARRFQLDDDQQARIRTWLRDLHISWGIDLEDRLDEGVAGQAENTLRQGLWRLLAGAAMQVDATEPWLGLLPVDVEGDDAELAGRFMECAETLFKWRSRFASLHPFGRWDALVGDACRELFAIDSGDAWQMSDLLQTLGNVCAQAEAAGFEDDVPAQVIASAIDAHYSGNRTAQSMLTGGVTFCAMLPMRGIPARIVAMVGLDDGCFPRVTAPTSFDDVARSPSRPGDRAARDEDRHLFLETLLAARERLIITYRGRNPTDDSELPRSVVLEELLETIDESFAKLDDGSSPSEWLVVNHPLHAHSSRYFDGRDARLVGLTTREFRSAVAREQASPTRVAGVLVPLREPEIASLRLEMLEQFWSMPAKYFRRHCLGAADTPKRDVPDALDPTELDGLGRYELALEQVLTLSRRDSPETGLVRWTARGRRPFSTWGKVLYDEQWRTTSQLFALLQALGFGAHADIDHFSIGLSTAELHVSVYDGFGARRIDWSASKLSAKHRVKAWLRHLAMSSGRHPRQTWIIRRGASADKPFVIERLDALDPAVAGAHLEKLWRSTRLGHRAPLPFFPTLACGYVQRLRQGASEVDALARAYLDYGDPLNDSEDEHDAPEVTRDLARLFGAEPPLAATWPQRFGIPDFPAFSELACAFFEPYFEQMHEVDPDALLSSQPEVDPAAAVAP